MKFKITESSPIPTILLALLLGILSTLGLTACNNGELSRAKAAEMIAASPGFESPVTLPVMLTGLDNGDPIISQVTGDNDTPERAMERAIVEYADDSPQFALANHLGIITPNLTIKETSLPKKSLIGDPWQWHLTANPVLNDKGKKLWADYGIPVNETVIPIALRDSPEITGMTKQGETEMAVEYSYKFVPNEIGKCVDSTSPEFKSLPTEIQDNIQGKPNKLGQPRERIDTSWSTERIGHAVFRKYDDGWRLIGAR